MSAAYWWCVNAIKCPGQNMSHNLLLALGEADANMYLCLEDLRPGANNLFLFVFVKIQITTFTRRQISAKQK